MRRAAIALAAWALAPPVAVAQLQLSTVAGAVLGPDGAPAAAQVTLLGPLGEVVAACETDAGGRFVLRGISPGNYALRAEASGLQSTSQPLVLRGGLPAEVTLRLAARAAESVEVTGTESGAEVRFRVDGAAMQRLGAMSSPGALQRLVASAPGWVAEDNGILHARGADDGFLYVIDGVPVYERLDPLFGLAPDVSSLASVQVLSGYIPAEYGLRSGGVVEVRSLAAAEPHWSGDAALRLGSTRSRGLALHGGGPLGRRLAASLSVAGDRSSRFLDPVDPDNRHNSGSTAGAQAELAWAAGRDLITLRGGAGGSRFDVPHSVEQDAAGQDARQRLGQGFGTASWQRSWSARTISQLALYGRFSHSRLSPSPGDTPLSADADRSQRRLGLLAAVSQAWGPHTLKAGLEAAQLRLEEGFRFAITDLAAAGAQGLSPAALARTEDDPFVFSGRTRRGQLSLYAQDSWRALPKLTLQYGLRYDRTRLLLDESQLSPRLGAAWRVSGATALRAAVNRFYQPPQAEFLLLSSSEQARRLSVGGPAAGGADVKAERQTAFELGLEQSFAGALRLDLALWHRRVRHQADPNVFLGTTIVFPNSVERGRATGLDVRLELPERGGWSAFASYTLSRVVQFGPLNGGLFLTDEVLEIGPGTRFTPDHDQRHVAAGALSRRQPAGRWEATLSWRYQSGTPIEVSEDSLASLAARPGADRVDFVAGRVKPALVFDVHVGARLLRRTRLEARLEAALLNLTDRRYAFNFGNPFSGTHFGADRTLVVGLAAGY
jgi:outer membrane receptor protein involved in Fe transport